MKAFLASRWFLLLLSGGVVLALLWPAILRPVVQRLPPQALVAVALFLMAWGLDSRSLGRSLLSPLPALWAAVLSYTTVPLLGWAYVSLVPLPADFRLGLLLMASVPCTLASAVLWTRLAGGNEATALLIVVLTTSTSWLITPLWLAQFGTGTVVALDTTGMMRDLLLFLVLPVVVGQLVRSPAACVAVVTRYRRSLGVVSQLLILAIILKAAVSVADRLREQTAPLALAPVLLIAGGCAATHLAALGAGLGSSRLLGFDRPSRIAIAFGCSQKTLPVALLLFESTYQRDYPLAVVPLVFYHIGQLVVDTLIADLLRHGSSEPKGCSP